MKMIIIPAARENPIANQGEELCPKWAPLGIRTIVLEGSSAGRKPNPKLVGGNFIFQLSGLL